MNSGLANGLMFDSQGRLVVAEMGGQRVVRRQDGDVTVLADMFGGRRLNSPNDLVVDTSDGVYFTDPQIRGGIEQPEAVYYLSPSGQLSQIITGMARPNGIILSPDERTLYVASSGGGR